MPLSLYIHIPFCISKCSYCSFTSFKYDFLSAEKYLKALELEICIRFFEKAFKKQKVNTIFVGGGTPTVLDDELIKKLFLILDEYFYLNDVSEFTVESNPNTLSKQKLKILKDFGVNRLSIGVQACQRRLLEILQRAHDYEHVIHSFELVRGVGFDNVNVDLIFGIPTQTLEEWEQSLKNIIDLQPEHIACYNLQLEEGTVLLERVRKGELESCHEELELKMYNRAIEMLVKEGYVHYEISNFSKPSYECKHNLCYWYNDDYAGVGLAAHSHVCGERLSNTDDLKLYVEKLMKGTLPLQERILLSKQDMMSETVFMGLRLINGVNLKNFYDKFNINLTDVWPDQLDKLLSEGLVKISGDYLRLTKKGLPIANVVFREFV